MKEEVSGIYEEEKEEKGGVKKKEEGPAFRVIWNVLLKGSTI